MNIFTTVENLAYNLFRKDIYKVSVEQKNYSTLKTKVSVLHLKAQQDGWDEDSEQEYLYLISKLRESFNPNTDNKIFCSGVLLDPNWILDHHTFGMIKFRALQSGFYNNIPLDDGGFELLHLDEYLMLGIDEYEARDLIQKEIFADDVDSLNPDLFKIQEGIH